MKKYDKRNITEDDIIDINSDSLPKNARSGGPELDIYEEEEEKLNEYYVGIAYRLRIAKFISFTAKHI